MWLAPDDFEQTHESHLKKRFGQTGQWLLDDPRFIGWRDDAQSSLLWCHGARKLELYDISETIADLCGYSGRWENRISVCMPKKS